MPTPESLPADHCDGATIVGLVVYAIMPRVVRLVASWLFR
jgi:hypothetical protein